MPRLIFVACALMGTEERTKPVLSRSTNPRLLSAKLKPKPRSLTSHRPFANIDAGCFPTSYQQDLERLRKAPVPEGDGQWTSIAEDRCCAAPSDSLLRPRWVNRISPMLPLRRRPSGSTRGS